MLAPIIPFITESIYQQIGTDDSLWHTIDLENEFNNLQRDFCLGIMESARYHKDEGDRKQLYEMLKNYQGSCLK